jgi:hypothetical protein
MPGESQRFPLRAAREKLRVRYRARHKADCVFAIGIGDSSSARPFFLKKFLKNFENFATSIP